MFKFISRSGVILLISSLPIIVFTAVFVQAQVHNPTDEHLDCDLDLLAQEQHELAHTLEQFEEQLETNHEAALEALYAVGLAYQTLALECGFIPLEATGEEVIPHNTTSESGEAESEVFVGDAENGEFLFNTMVPQTGFACATCHFTETTDRLIGPGLQGIGEIGHDPSEHAGANETVDPVETEHQEGDESDEHAEAPAADRHELIEYIRAAILHPSEFIVPTYPDNVMPQNYSEIYSEEEVNDLIAYLLTLD
jgi:hypothetical protein